MVNFEDDEGVEVPFNGVVTSYDVHLVCWHVSFSDGDGADYDWKELRHVLIPGLPFSPMARTRLKMVWQKGETLKAHKVRHMNQDAFEALITEEGGPLSDLSKAYVLTDYWAKLMNQNAHTACCENLGIGNSVLGTMLIHRNPTVNERTMLTGQMGGSFDWSDFGNA